MYLDDYTILMIARVRHQELLREAERERFLRAAGFRQPASHGLLWKAVGRLAAWLMQWNAKQQAYGVPSSSTIIKN